MKKEIYRKLFHIVSILLLLIPLNIFGKYSITILMILMLVIFYPISRYKIKNKLTEPFWILLEFIERKENLETLPAKQAFSLALGLIIVSLLFDKNITTISIICLAIYDGVATIVGRFFGKVEIINKRTLEGTTAGFIANVFILFLFVKDIWISILITIATVLIEISSSKDDILTDDNFTIPVGVAFFSWFLFLYLKGIGINV